MDFPSSGKIDLTVHQTEESNPPEPRSSLSIFDDARHLERTKDGLSTSHDVESSSCHPEGQVFWLNDYKCSLCGIELPQSFIEERQEHFDFHLAEKLQREESSNKPRILAPVQR